MWKISRVSLAARIERYITRWDKLRYLCVGFHSHEKQALSWKCVSAIFCILITSRILIRIFITKQKKGHNFPYALRLDVYTINSQSICSHCLIIEINPSLNIAIFHGKLMSIKFVIFQLHYSVQCECHIMIRVISYNFKPRVNRINISQPFKTRQVHVLKSPLNYTQTVVYEVKGKIQPKMQLRVRDWIGIDFCKSFRFWKLYLPLIGWWRSVTELENKGIVFKARFISRHTVQNPVYIAMYQLETVTLLLKLKGHLYTRQNAMYVAWNHDIFRPTSLD